MYSVLNKLSEYTYFYLSKNITSYIFCLFSKSLKAFTVSLRVYFCLLSDLKNYSQKLTVHRNSPYS